MTKSKAYLKADVNHLFSAEGNLYASLNPKMHNEKTIPYLKVTFQLRQLKHNSHG